MAALDINTPILPIPPNRNIIDLTGQRFTRLVVLGYVGKATSTSSRAAMWKCRCDCGTIVIVFGHSLRNKVTFSCGCWGRDKTRERAAQHPMHGLNGTREHRSWENMLQRCNNPKTPNYAQYGGRGIRVCVRWQESFLNFLADMGSRPANYSLDRIDNNGNYEPTNCRWTHRKQQSNNRRNTTKLTLHGRTQSMKEWAHELDVPYSRLDGRKRLGWSDLRILTERGHRLKK